MSDASSPFYQLRLRALAGALHLRIELSLSAPWTIIFGPSGSGKSTLLRAACGLLPKTKLQSALLTPDGPIELDGDHRRVPPHLRHFGYAPQGAVLFPHLSVKQNIAFSHTASGNRIPYPDAAKHDILPSLLDLFELSALAGRMPRDLSGGERQRVNLARAFAVPLPRLILLDEPFTGVDRGLRDRLLPRMQQHAERLRVPVLSVTHDVEEALMLGAEVVRLEQGQVVDQGPAPRVLAAERESILRVLKS